MRVRGMAKARGTLKARGTARGTEKEGRSEWEGGQGQEDVDCGQETRGDGRRRDVTWKKKKI